METTVQDEGQLILAYAMEDSDDAAWVLHRVGDDDHTAVMDDDTLNADPDAQDHAKQWASDLLANQGHNVNGLTWTPRRPNPSTTPDYWIANLPHDDE
ncbi:hypothetical protein ACN20G_37240 (plasmid) [Streptomyces sp. BI20]|uniref:hypothetical protein n=1 Tax=Streptomyces sp. BI20 TaxID=3403460 RepID=UPI003C795ED6